MRIVVMLRTIDEKQGIGVVGQNLMDHRCGSPKRIRADLSDPKILGRYAHYDQVSERLVTAPNCIGNNFAERRIVMLAASHVDARKVFLPFRAA